MVDMAVNLARRTMLPKTYSFLRPAVDKYSPGMFAENAGRGFIPARGLAASRYNMLGNKINMAGKSAFSGKMRKFMDTSMTKGFSRWGIGLGVAVGLYALSKSIFHTMSWLSPEASVQERGVGAGSGMISWSKKRGLPSNHLSTEGLSLSLHDMRHASTI